MLPNQAERFISIPKKCLPDFRTKIRTSGRHSLHKNIVYIDKFHFRIKIDAFILVFMQLLLAVMLLLQLLL